MAGSAAAVALAMFAAPTVVAAQTATYSFNIPAQDLGAALRAFGRASRQQVVFDAADTRGKRSTALVGTFTADAGLAQLLSGTGLTVRRGASGVLIVSDPGRADAGDPVDMVASELEDVVVTGTRIAGTAPVGAPVVTFDRDDIERSGAGSTDQFFAQLPQNFANLGMSNWNDPPQVGTRTSAANGVNLRGLGGGATLVLVNGRRLATADNAQIFDISQIPLSAIDRIEILADGASAIYGADAVAGVVNIILRREYAGAQTAVRVGGPGDRFGDVTVSQTAGFGWGGGNALLTLSYEDLPLIEGERAVDNGGAERSARPASSLSAINVNLSQDVGSWLTLQSDLSYSERELVFNQAETNYCPDCFFQYDIENKTKAGAIRALIELPSDWSAQLDLSASAYETQSVGGSSVNFGFFGTNNEHIENRVEQAEFSASGGLLQLPAGEVRVAVGASQRSESLLRTFATVGGLFPSTTAYPESSADVTSAFIELVAPLLAGRAPGSRPALQLSLAARYDDYSNFGDTTNPRVGLEWSPTEALRLRGTYSTSFKAPTLFQSSVQDTQVFFQNLTTPSGPVRVIRILGTAPLGPETSESWTLGFDLEPTSAWTLRATYFNTDYSDRIQAPAAGSLAMLQDPAFEDLAARQSEHTPADYAALIASLLQTPSPDLEVFSCPAQYRVAGVYPNGGCLEPATNFAAVVDARTRNIGSVINRGVDISAEGRLSNRFGDFTLNLNATFLLANDIRLTPISQPSRQLDTPRNPLDFRTRASLNWRAGEWDSVATLSYADTYINTDVAPTEAIDSWTTLDLGVAYTFSNASGLFSNIRLGINALNVFDVDAPFVRSANPTGTDYDGANANPYGRQISLSLTKNW
jgi:outer membrane receptor protein involved in Fe transport